MKLLIIDNYDSFTFNLKHMCEPHVSHISVVRNDEIDLDMVNDFDKIMISPGPGLPQDSGNSIKVIKQYYDKKPIMGVCLGAQAIALVFDELLYNLEKIMHGKQSEIQVIDPSDLLYKNIPNKIIVGRYHSWAIDIKNKNILMPTAIDKDNVIMSFRHFKYPIFGIQYHPESILTQFGAEILKNWLFS